MTTSGVIYRIIAQHTDEASFLYAQRCDAVVAPHYSLSDLSSLDTRLLAHLDGLLISGRSGWQICESALNEPDAGRVFVAAVVAFANGVRDQCDAVFRFCADMPDVWPEVSAALGWLPFLEVRQYILSAMNASSAALRISGLVAAMYHREDPGGLLSDGLRSSDIVLRRYAAKSIGLLGRCDLVPMLYEVLHDDEPGCRDAAILALSLLGDNRHTAGLTIDLPLNKTDRWEVINLIAKCGTLQAVGAWRIKLAASPRRLRDAVIAAGALGDPSQIPWLIDQMPVPALARAAGEAFTMITGIDLAYQDLETDKPEGFEAGPTENPEDENVEMDPDENLPWPDPELIAKWWSQHHTEFQNGTRYLLGKPISIDWCQHVLRAGRQRQRAAAALELAIRQPGQPLFNVAAPGFRQQQMLGLKK